MICALVLAAGRSVRMGRQKLLLPLGHKPAITGIVDELLRSPIEHISVVVGRDGAPIRQALPERAVAFVCNPEPDGDMLSSVRCGLRALPAGCQAVLVVLGDQPAVTNELLAAIISAFCKSGRGIIVPTHDGQRGHPILFAARFRDEVLTGHNGVGLCGLLRSHPEEVFELDVATAAVLEDMDTPEDYARRQARMAAGKTRVTAKQEISHS